MSLLFFFFFCLVFLSSNKSPIRTFIGFEGAGTLELAPMPQHLQKTPPTRNRTSIFSFHLFILWLRSTPDADMCDLSRGTCAKAESLICPAEAVRPDGERLHVGDSPVRRAVKSRASGGSSTNDLGDVTYRYRAAPFMWPVRARQVAQSSRSSRSEVRFQKNPTTPLPLSLPSSPPACCRCGLSSWHV